MAKVTLPGLALLLTTALGPALVRGAPPPAPDAADGASGSWLLEAQQPDGSWSTFASYSLRRLDGSGPQTAAPGAGR